MRTRGQYTTAHDVVLFTRAAMDIPFLDRVVRTKRYSWNGVRMCQQEAVAQRLVWKNTNALLGRVTRGGIFTGVKTGWVPAENGCGVHGCLVSRVESRTPGGRTLYVCVLGSVDKAMRFSDTSKLVHWARSLFTS